VGGEARHPRADAASASGRGCAAADSCRGHAALITAKVQGRMAENCFSCSRSTPSSRFSSDCSSRTLLRPAGGSRPPAPTEERKIGGEIVDQLLANIPSSLLKPIVDNNVIGVIIVAVTFAMATRRLAEAAAFLCSRRWISGSI